MGNTRLHHSPIDPPCCGASPLGDAGVIAPGGGSRSPESGHRSSHREPRLAFAVARSGNQKIGDAATTYAAQASCPPDCAFFDGGGCYAESGMVWQNATLPLNEAAKLAGATALDVAHAEADAIDAMKTLPGRPMRLHTVGDCATDETAQIVSAAAERYMERGGGPVWTYTHAWRTVARSSWGRVSVLASCETTDDFDAARERGYAPSIVLEEFPGRRRFMLDAEHVIPCPAQTTAGVSCTSCRLCLDDDRLFALNAAIGFSVHGTQLAVKKARQALRDPGDPGRRLTSRDHANRLRGELGRWPTTRELMDAADVTHASAWEMLKGIAAKEKEAATRAELGPRLGHPKSGSRSYDDPTNLPYLPRRSRLR